MPEFIFGLNTSTIRPAPLLDKIRIAARAGYRAIELWVDDVQEYLGKGHKLAEVRHALDDAGLDRPSMISLRGWCSAEEAKWREAMDDARRRLELARELGAQRIVASPPREDVAHELAVERYGQILELSCAEGVPASLEFLGFVEGINTLDKAWSICAAVGSADGTITPDAWHMFRGGSSPRALDAVPADHISCFHWNDAPATPARVQQTDADRVYPGDGILDLKQIARQLREKEYHGAVTLELFNRKYWEQDPLAVATTGLKRMQQSMLGG
jgi:sugar phosphate isomerase/epimerase